MVGEADGSWELRRDINYLNQLIRGLYAHLNLPLPAQGLDSRPAVPPGVVESLQRGNAIEAIKRWREQTGEGLAESKAKVDQIRAQMGL